jgi:hypothetical protein
MTRPRGYLTGWTPRADTQALITAAQAVLAEYRDYLPMTCRQIFYRLVGAHGRRIDDQRQVTSMSEYPHLLPPLVWSRLAD